MLGRYNMENVFIYVEGCERRVLDAKRIFEYFKINNFKIVYKPKNADIIIYVSCAVFCDDVKAAIKKVKYFQRYDAELIVAGCLPEMEKKELSKIFNGRVLSTKNIDRLDELFPENKISFKDLKDANLSYVNKNQNSMVGSLKWILQSSKSLEKLSISFMNYVLKKLLDENSVIYRIFIKDEIFQIRISWGCSCNCTYCTIPLAIGDHVSKPLEECLSEFKKGLKQGYTHFVLTADDTGAYGTDIGSSLTDLLDRITDIKGDYFIELHALNAVWLVKYVDELVRIVKKGKIRSILAPIESGSARILKLMNRYDDVEKIKKSYIKLKNSYPNLLLETHYLVGFPSENEDDVRKTIEFVNDVGFDTVYMFPFSLKTGSKAESISPILSDKQISRRLRYVNKKLKDVSVPVKTIK
jgi:tRNA A37 methylthiotransferase MiaB